VEYRYCGADIGSKLVGCSQETTQSVLRCTFAVRKTRTRASSFFAKKRDTLFSCIGGFSGIGNMANDEIERLRLTDEERQAIERQADWLAMQTQQAGDIHSADLRSQEAATLRGLLKRTQ
jgi:hypothetical protein